MVEMFDGKVTVDVSTLSENVRQYMIEFKEELLDHIEKKTKKQKPVDNRTNAQIHAANLKGEN